MTTPNWIPKNHIKPTHSEIQAQLDWEEQASIAGRIKARKKLEEQEKGMDYSRSTGASKMLDEALETVSACIKIAMDQTLDRVGTNCGILGPLYKELKHKKLVNLPKFKNGEIVRDGDGNPVTSHTKERYSEIWDSDDVAFIVLLTLLDTAKMPLVGAIGTTNKDGKRWGTRPDVYGLHSLISGRLQDHIAHTYIRRCLKGTGKDQLLDFILADAYTPQAGAKQKQSNTRRARKELAEEFIGDELGPFGELLLWKPWSSRHSHALAAKLISYTNKGLELALGFQVFKTVNRFDSQFYALTEQAEEWVDTLNQARIGSTFSPYPMLCQPRPHTPNSPGGFIGVAQGLIRSSFSGGYKGEFIASDQHLRLLNAQQNTAYRINKKILEVMQELDKQPHQEWREVGKFIPTPRADDFLKHPALGPQPEFMTPDEKEKRDELRKARKAEYRAYRKKETESAESYTAEVLALAEKCKDLSKFFIPVTGDFRGRIYCQNHILAPQGRDYQRALLQFGRPRPVDERTEHHLKIGIANAAGMDKKPYEERLAWFRQHKEQIIECTNSMDAITDHSSFWRTYENMDDAWGFLAQSLEWRRLFVDGDEDRNCYAITHRDSTCSGGQVLSCLLHSLVSAHATNLTGTSQGVHDIYMAVLTIMQDTIRNLDYVIPLRDMHGEVLTDEHGEIQVMSQRRVRYLFRSDDTARSNMRGSIKKSFLPKLYGASQGKALKAFKEHFRFLDYKGKKVRLTKDEARALSPFLEAAVDAVMPALSEYVLWCRAVVNKALLVPSERKRADGGEYKKQRFDPRVDADGNVIRELTVTTPNGSRMISRYPVTDTKEIRVDHLTTHSIFKPKHPFRDECLQVATENVDYSGMSKAFPPNAVHALDSCLLSFLVDGLSSDYSFSLIHDSIGMSPGKQCDEFMVRFNEALIAVTKGDYLQQIMIDNNVDPIDCPVPDYGTFDPEEARNAKYSCC